MKIYLNSHSIFCSRIEIAVNLKKIDCIKIEAVNNFKSFSPTGTIPCLIDGDFKISNTFSILYYLEKKFPSPSILSDNLEETSKIFFLSHVFDDKLEKPIRSLFQFVKPNQNPQDQIAIKHHYKELIDNLDFFSKLYFSNKINTNNINLLDTYLPSFFVLLNQFQVLFQLGNELSKDTLDFKKIIQKDKELISEENRYDFEIKNWISEKMASI